MVIGVLPATFSEYLQIWPYWYNTKFLGMKSYYFWAGQLFVYLQLFVYFCSLFKIKPIWCKTKLLGIENYDFVVTSAVYLPLLNICDRALATCTWITGYFRLLISNMRPNLLLEVITITRESIGPLPSCCSLDASAPKACLSSNGAARGVEGRGNARRSLD